jgi:hypothetical protein
MDPRTTLAIVSDIHYAGAAEQARGPDYEFSQIPNPALRLFARLYRNHVWLRDPMRQNHLVDRFIERVTTADYVIGNGDFSCNTGFVGVSDDAAFQSVRECLAKLRHHYGPRFQAVYGDHELGKTSLFAGRGGMRLASLHRAETELGFESFWRRDIGNYVLLGVNSSLVALPDMEKDMLRAEKEQWYSAREKHLESIRKGFSATHPEQRILLFCHDPTALPFLADEPAVQAKLPQLERTIIGHLHTNLVLWESRILAGIPPITFLGNGVRRMSNSLNKARRWRPFRILLCPALAGIQLFKGGGYYLATLDPTGKEPAAFHFHQIPRR